MFKKFGILNIEVYQNMNTETLFCFSQLIPIFVGMEQKVLLQVFYLTLIFVSDIDI